MIGISGWSDLIHRYIQWGLWVTLVLAVCALCGCMTLRDITVEVNLPPEIAVAMDKNGVPIPITINIGNKTIDTQATVPLSALGL